jgi:hypothetical protein
MSQAVAPYLVLDDRLNISDHIGFGVNKSAQSINQQTFTSQSNTSSSINLNCLVPSLSTVIDRHIQIKTQFQLSITGNVAVAGERLVQYPLNTCLAAFPFSQLVNQLSVQINNTTVNSNYQDTLEVMLRQMSAEDLAKYADLCPIMPDFYQRPSVLPTGALSPFQSVDNAISEKMLPRGSWVLDAISGNTAAVAGGDAKTVLLTFTTTEPIFCSPFLFGDTLDNHNAGLTGVSSINFNFNLDTTASRALRYLTQVAGGGLNVFTSSSIAAISSCAVLMTFLSPQPSQLIPLTSVLPYYELPIFKTTTSPSTTAVAAPQGAATFQVVSTVIAPNSIPDKLYLGVRKAVGSRRITDNESYFPINSITLTWNNNSGILGTATVDDLYYFSKKAGLKMPFSQFRGKAAAASLAAPVLTQLTGGVVCLDFCDMIPIMEDYYSSGSLGTWNFTATVNCENNTASDAIGQVELLTIFMTSGCFQTTSGVSSQYIGVLSKDIVLRVSQEDPITKIDNRRMVGGGWLSRMSSFINHPAVKAIGKQVLGAAASAAKGALAGSDSGVAQLASQGLGALGYGRKRQPRVKM